LTDYVKIIFHLIYHLSYLFLVIYQFGIISFDFTSFTVVLTIV